MIFRAWNPLSQATRTYYLYSDEGLIAEATQAIQLNAGSVTASQEPGITTQYGPRPDSPFTTGTLFVKTKNSNGQSTIAYYHHNHLDTPMQATDKNGNVVWAAQYEAFGGATIIAPSPTAERPIINSNLRLPGQYEDQETGLHYNWNRYYNPQTGRYVTSDPIGLNGGINFYLYVEGNPLGKVDPTGLVNWSGSMGGVAIIDGVGAGFFGFDLTSECKCGKKVRIKGFVSTVAAGFGFKYTASGSAASFSDTRLCPDPGIANGFAFMTMATSSTGGGGSISKIKLGGLISKLGVSGPVYGIDISVGVYAGASVVTSAEVTPCGECGLE